MTERGAAPVSSGVLVIDKPAGITSHDVVALIRRALHVRRIGHTGTLDPFATGVLPLCVGQATRLAQFLSADIKVYDAVVRLGWATETDDLKGAPITAVNSDLPSEAAVRSICREFVGRQAQVPPLYSAKWIDGRRAHERARQGQRVELAPAMVVIEELIVHGYRDGEISMSVACSAGTYIRALARDIGTRLGVGGHLRALRRTRSGEFTLEQAMPLDVGRGQAALRLIPMAELMSHWPRVAINEQGQSALRFGRDLTPEMVAGPWPDAPDGSRIKAIAPNGDLAAILTMKGGEPLPPPLSSKRRLHPDIVFIDVSG